MKDVRVLEPGRDPHLLPKTHQCVGRQRVITQHLHGHGAIEYPIVRPEHNSVATASDLGSYFVAIKQQKGWDQRHVDYPGKGAQRTATRGSLGACSTR